MRTLITLTLALLTALITGCGGTPQPLPDFETRQLAMTQMERTADDGDAVKPTRPGYVRIERHTAGYTISMVLDATDDNVYFVMDLPEDEKAKAKATDEPPEPEMEQPDPQPEEQPEFVDENRSSKHLVYAQTYFFEKKYNRALAEINRAIEYSPKSAVAYSLKGSIHFKRNETEEARAAWEQALELDPNLDNVEAMLAKLKR